MGPTYRTLSCLHLCMKKSEQRSYFTISASTTSNPSSITLTSLLRSNFNAMANTADQLPGCIVSRHHFRPKFSSDSKKISDRCMLHSAQGVDRDTFCESDLECICKVDNRLGSNALFSSDCLLDECTDGHGRKGESSLLNTLYSCSADPCSIPEGLA